MVYSPVSQYLPIHPSGHIHVNHSAEVVLSSLHSPPLRQFTLEHERNSERTNRIGHINTRSKNKKKEEVFLYELSIRLVSKLLILL